MSDAERLDLILMHIDVLQSHRRRGALDDSLILDAVCQRLASAIEEAKQVIGNLVAAEFGDGWPKILATRNAIAHSYRAVDPQLVAGTIDRDLDRFVAGIHSLRRQV